MNQQMQIEPDELNLFAEEVAEQFDNQDIGMFFFGQDQNTENYTDNNYLPAECVNLNSEGSLAVGMMNYNNYQGTQDQYQTASYNVPDLLYPPAASVATSENPCIDDFSGEMEFEIDESNFVNTANNRTNWIYSEILKKIFIRPNNYLYINFQLNSAVPLNGHYIRIVPVFTDADSGERPVDRCVVHSEPNDKMNKDFAYVDYVIKTKCPNSYYRYDELSQRRSICITLQELQPGTKYHTLNVALMCFNSCASINRRNLVLVFTLETLGKVIGRRTLNIRSCAAPKRDCHSEEKKIQVKQEPTEILETDHCTRKFKIPVPRECLGLALTKFKEIVERDFPCGPMKDNALEYYNSFPQ